MTLYILVVIISKFDRSVINKSVVLKRSVLSLNFWSLGKKIFYNKRLAFCCSKSQT